MNNVQRLADSLKNTDATKSSDPLRYEHLASANPQQLVGEGHRTRNANVMNIAATRAIGALRAEGRRITTARRTIIELLGATHDHLTAEHIATAVQHVHPEIHVSTVYRTLESLDEWGLVEHVHRGHGAAFFHLAASHPHMVCEQCGRVIDVPQEEFDALVTRVRDVYGFDIDVAHNALMGHCVVHDPRGGSQLA
jgi:Fe2+ or Zn2+ uptake regulation protein